MAMVIRRTDVAIIAQRLIEGRYAPVGRVTDVISAGVIVTTIYLTGANALTFDARIGSGAGIAVIAVARRRLMDAPHSRGAGVRSANIVVVAGWRWPSSALPIKAPILGRTGIPVAARGFVWSIDTPHRSITGIVRTRIPIIAVDRRTAGTHPLHALSIKCTGINIVAEETLMVGSERALPRALVA
jgi:hypothetical protein